MSGQAGIGTYNKRQFFTTTASVIASKVDEAVALHMNDHVKEGLVQSRLDDVPTSDRLLRYQFLMQNYRQVARLKVFDFGLISDFPLARATRFACLAFRGVLTPPERCVE